MAGMGLLPNSSGDWLEPYGMYGSHHMAKDSSDSQRRGDRDSRHERDSVS